MPKKTSGSLAKKLAGKKPGALLDEMRNVWRRLPSENRMTHLADQSVA